MQGSVQIDIEVGKADFSKATQEVQKFARDTGKALDPIKNQKLGMDVANATLKLQSVKQQLKDFQGSISQKKQLIIDTNNAQSQLTEAKRKLQNFSNTGDENLSRLQSKFNGIGGAISTAKIALGSFIGNIATGIFTTAVNGITNFAQSIVTLGARLEQTKVAFTTMLGSASEADKLLRSLTEFAIKTPFEINSIRDTAKQLLAFGFSASEIIPTLKSLGDVSAGLGVPIEQVAYAYGQVRTANQLYGTELRQFVNAGVPLLAQLAQQFGKTEAQVKKMVENGQVSFRDVEKAFQSMSGAGGRFENLMDKQSKTVAGAWSNFKDTITKSAEAMGIQLMPALAGVITGLTNMTQSIADTITGANNFTFGIGELKKAMAENKKEQEDLQKAYEDGQVSMVEYNRKIDALKASEEDLQKQSEDVRWSVEDINTALADLDRSKLSTDQKVQELKKIQIQAEQSAYALDKLIKKLEDARLGLSKRVAEEKKQTETGQRSLAGAGGVATTTQQQLNLIDFQLQAKKQEADSINKILSPIDKKLGGGTKKTRKTSSCGGGSSGASKALTQLEKDAKVNMGLIDDRIKESEGKWKDYQKEVENTKKKISELRDSAEKDINDINRQLADLQEGGAKELADRYAEIVNALAKNDLDGTERLKLTEEKAFIEGKVSAELRKQAVEYSKLSEAQQIYKDSQKEIADLTEKQNIAKAFLGGKIKTTAEGGIGIQDESDPNKIVAITNLKNQQYALDLVNKQQTYDLDLQAQQKLASDELQIYTDLSKEKLALEEEYTKLFGDEIAKQKALVDSLIQKMNELASARAKAGMGGSSVGTSTNTTNNTVNVNNNVDVKAVTNLLTSKTR